MSKFPCDGGCNWADGASEECSAHGRPPAEIWEIVAEVTAQRDAVLSRIARVEALHRRIGASWPHNGGVYVCQADGGIWPCSTVRALTEGEPGGA